MSSTQKNSAPKKRLSAIQKRYLALRNKFFPNVKDSDLWNRKQTDGWLTIPRTMPLILRIMDSLCSGKPVSSVYLELWCRTYELSFVVASKQREMAFYAGFAGERGESTWRSRMAELQKLGFIEAIEGPGGRYNYILIHDPHKVIEKLHTEKRIQAALYNALQERLTEIGAISNEK